VSSDDGVDAGDSWIEIRVEPSNGRDLVIGALFASGSLGIHEDGAAIVTHFPSGTSIKEICDTILAVDSGASVEAGISPQVDWSSWRASVGTHRVGALTISPPWLASKSEASRTIVIDPAMAFGTGEHPTTRGVILLMQQIQTIPQLVVDLGAGSAVLSIAAAKLGAWRVVAVELDPDAIGNAGANVAANQVQHRVHVIQGDAQTLLPLLAPADLVLANIVSSVLVGMMPTITSSVPAGGHAILSGILAEERDAVLTAIPPEHWRVVAERREESWWTVLIARL